MALITLEQARDRLDKVVPDHGLEDTQIDALIEAASSAIEAYLGRKLRLGQHEEWLDGHGRNFIWTRQAPLVSVEALEIDRRPVPEAPPGGVGYEIRGDRIFLTGWAFTKGKGNIYLCYIAGYEEVPAVIQEACLLTVQAITTASSMDLNLSGESVPGVYSASYSQLGPGSIPMGARSMIDPYRRFVL